MSDYNLWLNDLQKLIDGTLETIIPSKDDRLKYVTPDMMKIWSDAFTHETFSPSENYENLEYIGDGILKSVFPEYLRSKFPHFNKSDYTNLNTAYMSKMKQAELAKKLGFTNYIRVKGLDKAILNIETDVFESFVGALFTVGNTAADVYCDGKVVATMRGFNICYDFIRYLFENDENGIDESKVAGSEKTQVIQMFVRFNLGEPKQVTSGINVSVEATEEFKEILRAKGVNLDLLGQSSASKESDAKCDAYTQAIKLLENTGLIVINDKKIVDDGRVDFSVVLTPTHMNFINKLNFGTGTKKGKEDLNKIEITDPTIGYAVAATKKEASYLAYNMALKTLARHGINLKTMRMGKIISDMFGDPAISPHTKAAHMRAYKEGYESLYFFTPKKLATGKGSVLELIGVEKSNTTEKNQRQKEVALAYIYIPDKNKNNINAKIQLLDNYGLYKT